MLYTHANTKKAKVFDVDSKEEFHRVTEVSTSQGWLKVSRFPYEFDRKGNIICDKIRFNSIHAIRGRESAPCLFHCYGRIN